MTPRRKSDVVETVPGPIRPFPVTPLFPGIDSPGQPGRIDVTRTSPNDGFLLSAEPTIDNNWLRDEFGGGTYELTLYSNEGQQMAPPRRIKISGKPMGHEDLESKIVEKREEGMSPLELQARMFREQMTMLQTEAQAQRERQKLELELALQRARAEAELREERERERFERDMEKERQRAERERQERDAAAQRESERHDKFVLAIQAMQKEQTAVMVATLQSREQRQDPLQVGMQLAELIAGKSEDNGQSSQAWQTINKGLELASKSVVSAPVSSAVTAGGSATSTGPGASGKSNSSELKGLLAQILGKMKAEGVNPVEALKKVASGEVTFVPTDWVAEAQEAIAELDQLESGQEGSSAEHTASADELENRRRQEQSGANEAPVVSGPGGDGGPAATGAPRDLDANELASAS